MAPIVATNELSVSVSEEEIQNKPSWATCFPGPMDKNFDYNKLLGEGTKSFADGSRSSKRIAIIGCGAAGALAADELRRMGYKHVHVYEMDDGIGGRLDSRTHLCVTESGEKLQGGVPMEMAAMRMPQFNYECKDGSGSNSLYFKLIKIGRAHV